MPSPVKLTVADAVADDEVADYARSYVVALEDLPAGFSPVPGRVGALSNLDWSHELGLSDQAMTFFERQGRITGYRAHYSRDVSPSASGLSHVESYVGVYQTTEMAQSASGEYRESFLNHVGASPEYMPRLGDDSWAMRQTQRDADGGTSSLMAYTIGVQKGNLLITVLGAGRMGLFEVDEVLSLVQIALEQPRRALPS